MQKHSAADSPDQRLQLLSDLLLWERRLSNQRLRTLFGISLVRASEWLREFRTRHPDWTVHDTRSRSYVATGLVYRGGRSQAERRARSESLSRYLTLVGLPHAPEENASGLWSAFPNISIPDPKVFAGLNDAINCRQVVDISYRSMRNPEPHPRTLSPHSLVKVGRRWHVRAHCRETDDFRDYALGRIVSIAPCDEAAAVGADDDKAWTTLVKVRLVAHPLLSPDQQEVIRFEYFGGAAARVDTCRSALVPYFIQDVRAAIDVKKQLPPDYQLAVENLDEVKPWLFPT